MKVISIAGLFVLGLVLSGCFPVPIPSVLPLLIAVTPRIFGKIKVMRSYDGQRLPSSEWDIVREVVFERDGHACTYCGSRRDLEG